MRQVAGDRDWAAAEEALRPASDLQGTSKEAATSASVPAPVFASASLAMVGTADAAATPAGLALTATHCSTEP